MARNKFGAVKTTIDGFTFDSAAEAERYAELKILQAAGEIAGLELQPIYELQPRFKHGKKIIRPITYRADFRYVVTETGQTVVEDVKGIETEVFKIKSKMLLHVHGVEVRLHRRKRSSTRPPRRR